MGRQRISLGYRKLWYLWNWGEVVFKDYIYVGTNKDLVRRRSAICWVTNATDENIIYSMLLEWTNHLSLIQSQLHFSNFIRHTTNKGSMGFRTNYIFFHKLALLSKEIKMMNQDTQLVHWNLRIIKRTCYFQCQKIQSIEPYPCICILSFWEEKKKSKKSLLCKQTKRQSRRFLVRRSHENKRHQHVTES